MAKKCPVKVSAYGNSEALCIFEDSDRHEYAEWIDVKYLEPDAICDRVFAPETGK